MRSGKGDEWLKNYINSLYSKGCIKWEGLRVLLINMLQFDVQKRFNCKRILNDPWLRNTS